MRDVVTLRADVVARRASFEEKLAALVEAPSVSMEPERRADIDRCAALASEYLREIGAEVHIVPTGGYPMVIGRIIQDPAFPTVTVYNHLDVQPADPSEWRTPPFSFTRDGDRWRGRGTTDDKGPALTALFGAKLALEDGVRANIQFLWELEEEIGSPNFENGLRRAIAARTDRADGAASTDRGFSFVTDSVVVSDTIWLSAGRPALPYGLRGLMGCSVRLQTGAKDVHSGTTGGAARNPIAELAAVISECFDARTGRVKIPGFYDDVRKLSAIERRGLARSGFSRARFKAAHELGSLRFDDDARLAEAIMAAPTFEVHGLVGGYRGPGIKSIVPHAAEAKLSTRLVPDQRPAKIFRLVRDFIRKRCPDAEITHEKWLEPYISDIGGPHHEAAFAAMKETFGKEPALVREGGSIGAVVTMRDLLHAPVVFMGLSLPEHGYHAVDENFDWGQASGGMEMFWRYFHKIAAMGRQPPGARGMGPTPARKRARGRAVAPRKARASIRR
jgi:acetylornithine deacetylase/succinyl-diaminopimelate desuccinylase-like protein